MIDLSRLAISRREQAPRGTCANGAPRFRIRGLRGRAALGQHRDVKFAELETGERPRRAMTDEKFRMRLDPLPPLGDALTLLGKSELAESSERFAESSDRRIGILAANIRGIVTIIEDDVATIAEPTRIREFPKHRNQLKEEYN